MASCKYVSKIYWIEEKFWNVLCVVAFTETLLCRGMKNSGIIDNTSRVRYLSKRVIIK